MLEVIGCIGMLMALAGYGLLSMHKYVWAQIISLAACFFEGYYTYQHQAIFNVILSVAWAIIAIAGLAYWIRQHRARSAEYPVFWPLNELSTNPSR